MLIIAYMCDSNSQAITSVCQFIIHHAQAHALEEEMAAHSSILAWKIPRTEEPGGLQFTGLQRSQTRLSD